MPQKKYVGIIIKLGLPSGVTQAIFSVAMIVVQSLTNSFGEMLIAANVIIMRVDGFAMMPNFSFGTAMTTYAGQNVGARRYDRVHKGARQGTLIAVMTSGIITALILLFGRNLMSIFTETSELVDLSMHMMQIIAVGYIAMGCDPVFIRGDAGGRRHDDTHVDFSDYNGCHPSPSGIWYCLSDQISAESWRYSGMYFYISSGKLAHRRNFDGTLLQRRTLEEKSHTGII